MSTIYKRRLQLYDDVYDNFFIILSLQLNIKRLSLSIENNKNVKIC